MGSLADTITAEQVASLIEDLRDEAAPYVERAIPMIERAAGLPRRRSHRKRNIGLAALVLAGIAGVIAYLFWQRRDMQPAYLMDAPTEPRVTPTGSAPSDSPSAPSAPEPSDDHRVEVPHPVEPLDARSDRELASATGPRDERELRDARDERPNESARSLPTSASVPFATSRVQLPESARRSWLPR